MINTAIAIIPARGGSKRIPRKNINLFMGRPIISYTIAAARDSGCFSEIMVSTDDPEIAAVAKKYGAKVPFLRSKINSSDLATTSAVVFEVLSKYREIGVGYDFACCLYPAAPFITAKRLRQGAGLLSSTRADAVVPVVRFDYPIQRAFEIKKKRLKMIWPENINVRSQDLRPSYHDAGQFYWIRVDRFFKRKVLFGSNVVPLELPNSEVQDIDTKEDWNIAEMKFKIMRRY